MINAHRTKTALVAALAASLLLGAGCAPRRPLHIVRKQGDFAAKQGDLNTALADYQEYVDRMPNDPEARYQLGRTLIGLERAPDARTHMNVAHDIRPGVDKYADGYADALYKSGDTTALMTFLTKRTTERGAAADYLRLGKYSVLAGLPDEGLAALHTAAKIDRPPTATPYLALADFHRALGDRRNEVLRLRHALYLEPLNQDVQRRLADLGEIVGPSLPLRPPEMDTPFTPADPVMTTAPAPAEER
jgi:tetratricopeptide (TPR) repeat protein